MAFCHLFGLTTVNPFTAMKYVVLAHSSAPHSLLLGAWPDEKGYQSTLSDWKSTDGRSLSGSLRVQGGSYKPPERWELNAIANKRMVTLFNVLLGLQNVSAVPLSLTDKAEQAVYLAGAMNVPAWLPGYPVTGRADSC
jgi:hypothetical protein